MTAADTALEADEGQSDLDVVLPISGMLTVTVNTAEDVEEPEREVAVKVKRLRSMELLGILRILTTAFGTSAMGQLKLNTESPEAMQADMIAMLFMAIPNAAWEFVDLVNSITEPIDPDDEEELRSELKNPEADALLDIVQLVAEQERDSLHGLVGKLKSMKDRIGNLYTNKGKNKKGAPSRKR